LPFSRRAAVLHQARQFATIKQDQDFDPLRSS
jgi:hypothetical protein